MNEVGKRTRRTWSVDEKQRIIEEAVRPGASVAEIARRRGMNANLVFTWRRTALRSSTPADDTKVLAVYAPPSICSSEFVPIGVFAPTHAVDPVTAAEPSSTATGSVSPHSLNALRPSMGERPGVIEIDLANGMRLRVDAFVNERALRRVLSVLKQGV